VKAFKVSALFVALVSSSALVVACAAPSDVDAQDTTPVVSSFDVDTLVTERGITNLRVAQHQMSPSAEQAETNTYWFRSVVDGKSVVGYIRGQRDEAGKRAYLPALTTDVASVSLTDADTGSVSLLGTAVDSQSVGARIHGALAGNASAAAFAFPAKMQFGRAVYPVEVAVHVTPSLVQAFPAAPSVLLATKDACADYAPGADCTGVCSKAIKCTTQIGSSGSVSCRSWKIEFGASGRCYRLGIGGGEKKCSFKIDALAQDIYLPGSCSGQNKCQCHAAGACPEPLSPTSSPDVLLEKFCDTACKAPPMPSDGIPPCGGGGGGGGGSGGGTTDTGAPVPDAGGATTDASAPPADASTSDAATAEVPVTDTML
jgi:hypothetical protein